MTKFMIYAVFKRFHSGGWHGDIYDCSDRERAKNPSESIFMIPPEGWNCE